MSTAGVPPLLFYGAFMWIFRW